jgi:hypothetical protein
MVGCGWVAMAVGRDGYWNSTKIGIADGVGLAVLYLSTSGLKIFASRVRTITSSVRRNPRTRVCIITRVSEAVLSEISPFCLQPRVIRRR